MIRESYKKLFDIGCTDNKAKVVVTGTPGVGKTLFLLYCAHRLVVHEGKTVYLSMKGSRFNYIITPSGFQSLDFNSVQMPKGSEWYYLADSVEPYLVQCALTILSVSPRMKFANEFRKSANTYYMPLWEWDEILKLVGICKIQVVGVEELKHRFEILNGVPRKLFAVQHQPEKMVDLALSESNVQSLMTAPETSGNIENVAHLLIVRTTEDYVNFRAQYASRYIARRVYDEMKTIAKKEMYSFVRSSGHLSHLGPVRGTLYEYIAHDLLLAGGKFKRRRLVKDNDGSTSRTNAKDITIPASETVIDGFGTLSQAYETTSCVEPNTYFKPKDGFESVDAWKQKFAMFQMTVKKDHDIKKLAHEVAHLCGSTILYFVVADEDRFRNFKYQDPDPPISGVKPVMFTEYVLWVPVPEDQ